MAEAACSYSPAAMVEHYLRLYRCLLELEKSATYLTNPNEAVSDMGGALRVTICLVIRKGAATA